MNQEISFQNSEMNNQFQFDFKQDRNEEDYFKVEKIDFDRYNNFLMPEVQAFSFSFEKCNDFGSFDSENDDFSFKYQSYINDYNLDSSKDNKTTKRSFSNNNLSSYSGNDKKEISINIEQISEKDCKVDTNWTSEFENEDLNAVVDKILTWNPVEFLKDQGIEVDDKTAQMLSVNKRKRKTKNQIQLLDLEYSQNPNWTKEFMKSLAKRLNMSTSSIYKWHWDQKHKNASPKSKKN